MESLRLNEEATPASLVRAVKERRAKGPVLYLIVIGFHHKKGCQIEYVYPNDFKAIYDLASAGAAASKPTTTDEANGAEHDQYTLPKRWKYLPSLALPDGSHNYESDYVYFHLEDFDESDFVADDAAAASKELSGLKKALPTVFGISCYRQIDASELITRDSEVTRNTLQKSVCILASQPLYGSIRAKLESITLAYFNQKDFHKTGILDKAFVALAKTYEYVTNQSGRLTLPRALPTYLNRIQMANGGSEGGADDASTAIHLSGFSVGDLVLRYQHKLLTLFKLLLLQKKCLFQMNPVGNLSSTILTLVSLVPDVFVESASSPPSGIGQSKSLENLLENEVYEPGAGEQESGRAEVEVKCHYQYCSGFFNSMDLIDNELERKGQIRATAAKPGKGHERADASPRLEPREGRLASDSSIASIPVVLRTSPAVSKSKNGASSSTDEGDELCHFDITQLGDEQRKKGGRSGPKFASKKMAQDQIKRLKDLNASMNSGNSASNSNDEDTGANRSSTVAAVAVAEPPKAAEKNLTLGFLKNKFNKISNILTSTSPLPGLKYHASSPVMVTALTPKQVAASPMPPAPDAEPETPQKQQAAAATFDLDEGSRNLHKELEEFLRTNFGMPLKLFSEFNVLHPYLSLYYLDYFSMVNKMSTTLFCTTFKLNNMTRYAKLDSDRLPPSAAGGDKQSSDLEAGAESQLNNSNLLNDSWSTNDANFRSADVESKIGYTIGATNVLFKQRLQDKLDAFVDESEIDLDSNDELKKQLELTTADQRFMYFIIKNVTEYKANSGAGGVQGEQQSNSNNSTSPGGVDSRNKPSIRRSTSVNIYDKSSMLSAAATGPETERRGETGGMNVVGSDEWVRSYFKWYLYSLLGSMLREDIYQGIRTDLDVLLSANFDHPDNKEVISIDESIASLDNSSMIDINDVLYENESGAKAEPAAAKPAQTKSSTTIDEAAGAAPSKSRFHKSKKSRAKQNRDNLSVSSMTNAAGGIGAASTTVADYRDDFNKYFVDEFKKTACYREWYAHNKARLATNLFKLHSPIDQPVNIDVLDPNSRNLALKLLMTDAQSLEQSNIAHPFNTSNGSYLNDMKIKMSFILSSTDSGKRINKALTESSKVLSGVFKTAFSPFMKQSEAAATTRSAALAATAADADNTNVSSTKM